MPTKCFSNSIYYIQTIPTLKYIANNLFILLCTLNNFFHAIHYLHTEQLVTAITLLPPLLWRHFLTLLTSPLPLLWRHYLPLLWHHKPCYYDVTNPATMTSLPPLLWRHYLTLLWRHKPRYYDVTNPATMTSLYPLLWRHYPRYYLHTEQLVTAITQIVFACALNLNLNHRRKQCNK